MPKWRNSGLCKRFFPLPSVYISLSTNSLLIGHFKNVYIYLFILTGNTSFLDRKIDKLLLTSHLSASSPGPTSPHSDIIKTWCPCTGTTGEEPQNYESYILCRVAGTSAWPPLRRYRKTFALEFKQFLSGERMGRSYFIPLKSCKWLQGKLRGLSSGLYFRVSIQLLFNKGC